MAKKNGNGEGTRPRRRLDGRWEARFWEGERRRSIYGRTRKEVVERLTQAISDAVRSAEPTSETPTTTEAAVTASPGAERPKPTFGEFLPQYEESARYSMKKRSYETYEEVARIHLLPSLGHVELSGIRREHVQRLYAEKLDDGLSPARVRRIHGVLNSILSTALRWELIERNACGKVTLPRIPSPEVRPFSLDEARRFLEYARTDERYYALFALGVTSGARWGELTGLFWSDLDFDARTIRIRRTLVRGKGRPTFDVPKTSGSMRTIRMSNLAHDALLAHSKLAESAKLPADGDYLVFTSRTGNPVNHSSFTRHAFKPLLRKAGLPDTTWHAATRHTATCLLLLDRVDPKSICIQMGWSSVAFMLENYARFMPGWEDAGAIDRILELR